MKKNDRFQFVIYRENYLSDIECDKLIQALDTEELKEGELVGDYTDGIINKNVRQTLNIDFRDENLFVKLNNAIKLANEQYFNYDIDSIDTLRFLKYGIGGTYNWHTDYTNCPTPARKFTVVVQLSEPTDYEGGEFELFPNVEVPKERGLVHIFPPYLYHRVKTVQKGRRKVLVTWVWGPPFV